MESRNVRITQGTEKNMPQCQPGALRRNSFELLLPPQKKNLPVKIQFQPLWLFRLLSILPGVDDKVDELKFTA